MAVEGADELKRYNRLYLEIIMRYHDLIDEKENIYVAELPRLVMPKDTAVVALAGEITSGFGQYDYDRDFSEAARKACAYVRNRIENVTLPVQFWLIPGQTIEIGAGDDFDKATLLCSMLVALGNLSSKIIITVDDSKKTTGIYFDRAGGVTYVDVVKGTMEELGSRAELLSKLGIKEGSEVTAYEFNDKMYSDLL